MSYDKKKTAFGLSFFLDTETPRHRDAETPSRDVSTIPMKMKKGLLMRLNSN